MKYVLFLFALIIAGQAIAQPTVKDYENKTIFTVDGKYEKGKKAYSLQEIVAEINKFSKEGGMFATDGYKDYKTSKVLNVVSLSLSLAALALILDNKSTRSLNFGLALSLASFIPSSFAVRYRKKGNQKIAKAIWLHNKDILF